MCGPTGATFFFFSSPGFLGRTTAFWAASSSALDKTTIAALPNEWKSHNDYVHTDKNNEMAKKQQATETTNPHIHYTTSIKNLNNIRKQIPNP